MLSRLLYYLVLKPLSYLPLNILYLLSDFLYLLLYKIFRYRQKVVRTNLVNSFPGKSLKEIKKIEQKFYSHFCDLIIESIRLFSISEKELRRRSRIVNPEMILDLYEQGRGVIMVAGHYNNWEMAATIMGAQVKHQVIGIYTPMSNKFFDKKFKNSREKFGIEMVSKKIVKEEFEKNKESPTITLFATDQSPTYSKNVHWTKFLHQPTAVFLGTERFAKEYDLPVVFGYIKKIRRGYYELKFVMMDTHPSETPDGEITEKHT
ncbi:MAG TPA: lysophospholipid acyltransferase family protein, partial [Chitinophagaceae bacterium]|nr:lysophospholipid acyltransferase family protein [Chitinophagaceae bacterium]